MIKRILDPAQFKTLLDEIFDLFEMENREQGHALLKHNKEYIFNAFGNESILTWDFFVWGNLNDEGKFDAVIAFLNNKNEKFGEEIFSEYIWLSKNPRVGQKLLGTAMKVARKKSLNTL